MNAVANGPAVGAACESPKHQESHTHVQHTVSHNNNPANNKPPVVAAVESPKDVNPVCEERLRGTTSAEVDGFDENHDDEERYTSLDDGCCGTSDSDFLSDNESSKRI